MDDKKLLELLNDAANSVAKCGGEFNCSDKENDKTQLQIDAIDEAIRRLGLLDSTAG